MEAKTLNSRDFVIKNLSAEEKKKPSHFKRGSVASNELLQKTKVKINAFLDNTYVLIFSTIITVWSLFSDDIRQLVANRKTDDGFYVVTLIVFAYFSLEIIVSSFAVPRYFLSFYFWLDIVSTVSMLLDVGWISALIFGSNSQLGAVGKQGLKLARAARASKVGSKAGRMLRILRLIRLIRIAKVYKVADQAKIKEKIQMKVMKNQNEAKGGSVLHENGVRVKDAHQSSHTESKKGPRSHIKIEAGHESMPNFVESLDIIQKIEPKMKSISKMMSGELGQIMISEDPSINSLSINKMPKDTKGHISIADNIYPKMDSQLNSVQSINVGDKRIKPQSASEFELSIKQSSSKEQSAKVVSMPKSGQRNSVYFKSGFNREQNQIINPLRRRQTRRSVKTSFGEIIEEFDSEDDLDLSGFGPRESKVIDSNSKDLVHFDTEQVDKETNIGKRLSDLTTKRVIIIVLLLLIMIPIFSSDTYFVRYSNYDFGIMQIYNAINQDKSISPEVIQVWKYFVEMIRYEPENLLSMQLIYFQDEEDSNVILNYGDLSTISTFRDNELDTYSYPADLNKGYIITLYLETSYYEDVNSIFSIFRTLAICVILIMAAFYFAKDVTNLVLSPVENMLKIINSIKENPLNAVQIEEEDAFMWGKIANEDKDAFREREQMENYETAVLEKIVLKIGALLAISFGEAGSEIIIQNMKQTGEINPIIPGKRIYGIFGFCDIRSFTDVTEILQEEIMVFVNTIGEIVHSTVDRYAGSANKNIGDAFLLVWKFPNQEEISEMNLGVQNDEERIKTCYADMSIISFIKIMMEMYKSRVIDGYNKNTKLTTRIKNFRVKMGFGLSQGWAIEGAIGSEYKIDASYLSPHVNMASRLEGATKGYGVPMLIADSLRDLCSSSVKRYLRQIDTVTLVGDPDRMNLYTFDALYSNLELEKLNSKPRLMGIEKKRFKFINRNKKRSFHRRIFTNKISTESILSRLKDFRTIRTPYTQEFYDLWDQGFADYTLGRWEQAEKTLTRTLNFVENYIDGPSEALLSYMTQFNFKPPLSWNGMREFN